MLGELALALTLALPSAPAASTAPSTASTAATATAATAATKLPVLLVPGFFGWDRLPVFQRYMEPTARALERDGRVVKLPRQLAVQSSDVRADVVEAALHALVAETGAERVLVVAHSQGGLDTRAALRRPSVRAHVAGVLTLVTPHDGTPVANAAQHAPWLFAPALVAVHHLWQCGEGVPCAEQAPASTAGSFASLALSARGAQIRDAHGADVDGRAAAHALPPGVPFFSVAGFTGALAPGDRSCEGGRWGAPKVNDLLHPIMIPLVALQLSEGYNIAGDGLVPTATARAGTFLGCVPTDHFDWLGWHTNAAQDGPVFDETAFVVVAARGLDAVAAAGDEGAFDVVVPALAALAHATPLAPW